VPASRVVVTGMGAVSAVGVGVNALWTAARLGRSAVRQVEFARRGEHRVKIAAQVKGFEQGHSLGPDLLPSCDPFSRFAIVAADEAVAQAGFSREQPMGAQTAVIIGTGVGGLSTLDDMMFAYYVSKARLDPLTIPRIMGNAAASLVSIRYGCTGPTFAVASACSSATQAIGIGALFIRSGVIDRAIVGGSEAGTTPASIRAWELLRVLTPDCCRPFSLGRNGMVLGEGAGVFVLESEKLALSRGATPLAEVAGYGTSSDAKDLVRPDADGAAAAIERALEDAGLAPEAVDYVNAHGTGTIANDAVETQALRRVFGARLAELPASSTKPIHGHALGAAGGLELAITIMALRENVAPPTINWLEPDPKCDLDPIPNQAREMPIRAAMSNSFAFGGINACLVVRRFN
jgi:nodulation protein E